MSPFEYNSSSLKLGFVDGFVRNLASSDTESRARSSSRRRAIFIPFDGTESRNLRSCQLCTGLVNMGSKSRNDIGILKDGATGRCDDKSNCISTVLTIFSVLTVDYLRPVDLLNLRDIGRAFDGICKCNLTGSSPAKVRPGSNYTADFYRYAKNRP